MPIHKQSELCTQEEMFSNSEYIIQPRTLRRTYHGIENKLTGVSSKDVF